MRIVKKCTLPDIILIFVYFVYIKIFHAAQKQKIITRLYILVSSIQYRDVSQCLQFLEIAPVNTSYVRFYPVVTGPLARSGGSGRLRIRLTCNFVNHLYSILYYY